MTIVVFDFADNWGGSLAMMIRSIEFKSNGVLLQVGNGVSFTAYGTQHSDTYEVENAFMQMGFSVYDGRWSGVIRSATGNFFRSEPSGPPSENERPFYRCGRPSPAVRLLRAEADYLAQHRPFGCPRSSLRADLLPAGCLRAIARQRAERRPA